MSKFLRYLKPNFSSHWGNWLLAPLMAFFVGYLPATAFSAEFGPYDTIYWANDGDPYSSWAGGVCSKLGIANACSFGGGRILCHSMCDSSYPDFFDHEVFYGKCDSNMWHPACNDDVSSCPDAGTVTTINVPLAYGSTLPEYYSVNGCQFVVTGFECEVETEFKRENCDVEGEYTGEEASAGPSPGDPGDKPKIRCYYPDGQQTQLIDYDAPCPEGSTREPPTDPNPDPGTGGGDDGGDGGECDPTIEQCPTDPEPDQCDPAVEQCPTEPTEEGDPENGVADMGQTEMAQYCRDNPKAAQCAEYVHKKVEEADKGRFDIAAIDIEIEKKWLELDGVIQETRTSIENKFSLSVSSGAGLPCFPFITWKGATEHVCLSDHADAFSKIAAVVLFICVVIGILIILR